MSTEAKHTPTPWSVHNLNADDLRSPVRFDGPCIVYADDDCSIHPVADCSCNHTCRFEEECVSNAEFIVRACNAHDDLVAALHAFQDAYEQKELIFEAYEAAYQATLAALVKAGGP